ADAGRRPRATYASSGLGRRSGPPRRRTSNAAAGSAPRSPCTVKGPSVPPPCNSLLQGAFGRSLRRRRQPGVQLLRPEAHAVVGRELLQLEVEDLGERGGGVRPNLVDRHRTAELARDRRELGVLEPAGGDPVRERRRVEIDVEG